MLKSAAALAAGLFVLASCGEAASQRVGAAGGDPVPTLTASTSTTAQPQHTSTTFPVELTKGQIHATLNMVVHDGETTAVIGTILSVGPERWNSTHGGSWTRSRAEQRSPIRYFEATVRVEEILYDKPDSTRQVGDVITVVSPTMSVVGPSEHDHKKRSGGRFEPGLRSLLVMTYTKLMFDDMSERPVLGLPGHRGNWTIREDGTAENYQPGWSGPLERIKARILEEKQAGQRIRIEEEAERAHYDVMAPG